jgi:hypothetical protein
MNSRSYVGSGQRQHTHARAGLETQEPLGTRTSPFFYTNAMVFLHKIPTTYPRGPS